VLVFHDILNLTFLPPAKFVAPLREKKESFRERREKKGRKERGKVALPPDKIYHCLNKKNHHYSALNGARAQEGR